MLKIFLDPFEQGEPKRSAMQNKENVSDRQDSRELKELNTD